MNSKTKQQVYENHTVHRTAFILVLNHRNGDNSKGGKYQRFLGSFHMVHHLWQTSAAGITRFQWGTTASMCWCPERVVAVVRGAGGIIFMVNFNNRQNVATWLQAWIQTTIKQSNESWLSRIVSTSSNEDEADGDNGVGMIRKGFLQSTMFPSLTKSVRWL